MPARRQHRRGPHRQIKNHRFTYFSPRRHGRPEKEREGSRKISGSEGRDALCRGLTSREARQNCLHGSRDKPPMVTFRCCAETPKGSAAPSPSKPRTTATNSNSTPSPPRPAGRSRASHRSTNRREQALYTEKAEEQPAPPLTPTIGAENRRRTSNCPRSGQEIWQPYSN
jgi:hypothetical protein